MNNEIKPISKPSGKVQDIFRCSSVKKTRWISKNNENDNSKTLKPLNFSSEKKAKILENQIDSNEKLVPYNSPDNMQQI